VQPGRSQRQQAGEQAGEDALPIVPSAFAVADTITVPDGCGGRPSSPPKPTRPHRVIAMTVAGRSRAARGKMPDRHAPFQPEQVRRSGAHDDVSRCPRASQ
jgi:hypothetical protein